MNEETQTAIRAHMDEAALADALAQGRGLSIDDAVALAFGSRDGEPPTLEDAPPGSG